MKLDDRPIKSIHGETGGEEWSHNVGPSGVTKITVEEVDGQMGTVPWFAVRKGDKLVWRENAAHVHSVQYQ